jgi:hypothetical protein
MTLEDYWRVDNKFLKLSHVNKFRIKEDKIFYSQISEYYLRVIDKARTI